MCASLSVIAAAGLKFETHRTRNAANVLHSVVLGQSLSAMTALQNLNLRGHLCCFDYTQCHGHLVGDACCRQQFLRPGLRSFRNVADRADVAQVAESEQYDSVFCSVCFQYVFVRSEVYVPECQCG